jgi:hypothetical protein
MSAADYTRFLKVVMSRLPGAVESAVKLEMFEAVNEFLADTSIWQEAIPFTTVANRTDYSLPAYNGQFLRLISLENTDGTPYAATMNEPGTIVLATEPAGGEELTATVAMTIVDPTTDEDWPEFPEWIFTRYRGVIQEGLLMRMLTMPAKPFTNAQFALIHGARFRAGIGKARVDVQHGNLQRGQRWQFPQNFATGR